MNSERNVAVTSYQLFNNNIKTAEARFPKRDEVIQEWSKLHNDEFNDLYSSSNIVWAIKSRIMRCAGNVARLRGEERCIYRILVGKLEGKRPLGIPSRRWKDTKMDIQEVGCGTWTGSIWLRIIKGGGHL